MLNVRDLCVARGGVQILQNLTLNVPAGSALVLRGPNGIGKTTVLRTLAGLQPARSGQVEITQPHAFLGHLDAVKPSLSVAENLGFWAEIFGHNTAAQVDGTLAAFDLTALATRLAGTLSAGQKRRLALAWLQISGAGLWLLDEPTVSLDDANVALFQTALAQHLGHGGAAVLSTHIALGITAPELDLTPYKCQHLASSDFDGAFL